MGRKQHGDFIPNRSLRQGAGRSRARLPSCTVTAFPRSMTEVLVLQHRVSQDLLTMISQIRFSENPCEHQRTSISFTRVSPLLPLYDLTSSVRIQSPQNLPPVSSIHRPHRPLTTRRREHNRTEGGAARRQCRNEHRNIDLGHGLLQLRVHRRVFEEVVGFVPEEEFPYLDM